MNQFINININQQFQMVSVNCVLVPFEGEIKPVDPTGIKIYLQVTKEMEKETYKLNFSVSNSKYIIDHFLSIANKYCWGCLAFMVNTLQVQIIYLGWYSRFSLQICTYNHLDILECKEF